MEAFKEAIAASKKQACILKGNQMKPQSSIPFSISPLIASSSGNFREEESTNLESSMDNALDKKNGVITPSSSSASTLKAKEDEEDLNIANCLILLSQGHPLAHNETNNDNRFSSRRFLETSSNGDAKAGYYVYQCKTCDRTFSSFQALGGHRASHKKPKTASLYSKYDLKKNMYQNDAVSLVTTTTIHNNKNSITKSLVPYGKASKVHECGICGTEFTSGQALGGHMRRHRGAVVTPIVTVANTELSLSSMSFDQISNGQDHIVMPERKRAKNTIVSLDLDLNLLPASEDENRVNGFNFGSKQKQEQEHHQHTKQKEEPKSLVFSAPTLVDCHY